MRNNMELPENILRKAYEGGYKHGSDNPVLEAEFFQALSKACGWDVFEYKKRIGTTSTSFRTRLIKVKRKVGKNSGWKYKALRFHEINLTENWEKAVSYLQTITDEK